MTVDPRAPADEFAPSLVVIGAPKCGTTSLAWWLRDRDDVTVPVEKELRYLDQYWERGPNWYRERFDAVGKSAFTMEATPTYLAHPTAPKRATSLPGTRFVAIVRDPVVRAWSHHWFDLGQRGGASVGEGTAGFEEMVETELATDMPVDGILTHGRYSHHLGRWAEHVGRDRLLVLTVEQLADDPAAAFRATCEFMAAPTEPVPESVGTVHNRNHQLRSTRFWLFMLRHRLFHRLPPGITSAIDGWNRKTVETPPMPDRSAALLADAYRDDVHALTPEWLPELPPWEMTRR